MLFEGIATIEFIYTLKLTHVRSHEKLCVDTQFFGEKVTHDKYDISHTRYFM